MIPWFLLSALIGYLLGTVPTGYLVGRRRGIDIRQWGSGATGGTNVIRTLGWTAGIATGAVDIAKGILAAYIGFRLGGEWGYAIGGFAAALGHSYPFWLQFRGGKSVATAAGALAVFHPWAFLVGFTALVAAIVPTRYVSFGSLVGSAVFVAGVLIDRPHPAHAGLAICALILIYVRHLENIKRLIAGKENKFGQKARPRTEG